MRLVLSATARFEAVDEHLSRCGLRLDQIEPQVFPARPEPASAAWVGPDGEVVGVFRYRVNPDRRTLALYGDDADAIARTIRASLGTIEFDEIATRLRSGTAEEAFVAAFLASAADDPGVVGLLCDGLRDRDAYVGIGCLRALEIVGDPAVVPTLRAIRADGDRAGELRLLAGEIADALARGRDLH